MYFNSLFYVAFISMIVSSAKTQCPYEQNIDYFGYDISPNQYLYYQTQDLCCAACQANPTCQGKALCYELLCLVFFLFRKINNID